MKPIFFMMVGLPASGKSTYARTITVNNYSANIHSSDSIRTELYGDENCQDNNDRVFGELSTRIKSDLTKGINTIHDATNINWKRRRSFLDSLNKIDCYKVCLFMATSYEDCLKQNELRERKVPVHVITNMYKNIYIPQNYEGWDDVIITMNSDPADFYELFDGGNGLNKINQDNPNHTLTIGEHCQKCHEEIDRSGEYVSVPLSQAALFHDIGKRFTKEFKNARGEPTDIAHYYQHQLVSAYDSLFYNPENIRLQVANYIQWHMQPFFSTTEKSQNKYRKLWGDKFYNDIMLLHEADKKAH